MSLEERSAGCPNKLLSQCIRTHSKEICRVLTIHKNSFLLLTLAMFGDGVIDQFSKQSVNEEKGVKGPDLLLDLVRSYLDGDEDDIQRYNTVMKCFEDEECLIDVLKKIRKDMG